MDYSSAFNTIVPATLVAKLQTLGLNRSLCSWILDFLTGRSQVVRMGNNTFENKNTLKETANLGVYDMMIFDLISRSAFEEIS